MPVPGWAIANLAVSVGSSLLGNKGAKKEEAKQKRRALKAARIYQGQLVEEAGEVKRQAAEDLFQQSLQTMAIRGQYAASAAAAGVSGVGVDLLGDAIEFEGSYNRAVTGANSRSKLRQIKREFDAAPANYLAGVTARRPNPLATGLQIIGAVAEFGEKYWK